MTISSVLSEHTNIEFYPLQCHSVVFNIIWKVFSLVNFWKY